MSDEEMKEPSLQDAFEAFRRKKSNELRLQMLMNERKLQECRTDQYKDNLRLKFLDSARKYLGVPYHIKFKSPDADVSPLYLDW